MGDQALLHEIIVVANGLAARLRPPGATDRLAPHSAWSIAEVAAHVAAANQLFAKIASGRQPPRHGDGTRAGLAEANDRVLAEYTERDPSVLAGQIVSQAELFVQAARARSDADTVDSPLGPMPMPIFNAYVMAHMLSHGYAIAAGLGRRLVIEPRQVSLMRPFLISAMPMFVDPAAARGTTASYRLRLRGITAYTLSFTDGALAVRESADGPVDCTISADPESFFLIATGQRSPWPLIAQGKVRAWGRRPWLAMRFAGLFTPP
jgi:uncharacterized protein (TIGR03083 family)